MSAPNLPPLVAAIGGGSSRSSSGAPPSVCLQESHVKLLGAGTSATAAQRAVYLVVPRLEYGRVHVGPAARLARAPFRAGAALSALQHRGNRLPPANGQYLPGQLG